MNVVAVASRRPRANPRSVGMWEREVAAVNLGERAPVPLLFFIARSTGANQPYLAGRPRSGRNQRVRADLWIVPLGIISNSSVLE